MKNWTITQILLILLIICLFAFMFSGCISIPDQTPIPVPYDIAGEQPQ